MAPDDRDEYQAFLDAQWAEMCESNGWTPAARTAGFPAVRDDDQPEPQAPGPGSLKFASVSEIRSRVAARGPRQWAIRGVWIAGTAMVVGAEEKAGKSVGMLHLAVALASGRPWMGCLPVEQTGPVLCFWGEDDDAEVLRRLDAICASEGLCADDLPIRMCFAPPNLSRPQTLDDVRAELDAFPCAAVILDPLYLSIGEKGDGASLYAMGPLLRTFGEVCQQRGAAPVVIHHWNKGGTGTGKARLSGTGTTQWARTILSMSVAAREVETVTVSIDGREVVQHRATAMLQLEFEGNSIVPRTLTVRRRMWADDPDDLNSLLHYEVGEALPAAEAASGGSPLTAEARSLAAVEALGGWVGKGSVQEWDGAHLPVRRDGSVASPLKRDTAYRALKALVSDRVLVSRQAGQELVFALPGTPVPGGVPAATVSGGGAAPDGGWF